MNKQLLCLFLFLSGALALPGQSFEVGMEFVTGPARTSVRGDLASMVGFSEIELSEDIVDSAFASFNIDAPRWIEELYPGIRITVEGEVNKKVSRNIPGVRFFARYHWFGASFTVSEPRLTEPKESARLKNQLKSVRLALGGKADELAEHLARMAAADVQRNEPFFSKRYDLEGYVHLKKLLLGDQLIAEWGDGGNGSLDFEVTSGIRFTADPSPVVDLGSILFVSETLDSLMEGGILAPVEHITDDIAEAIQNVVFGKFKDPRTVPSLGWFARGHLLANLSRSLTVVAGAELSVANHLSTRGTGPMTSLYGFVGLRINVLGK